MATRLPARLTGVHGTESVILQDISLTGAQIGIDDRCGIDFPLRAGEDAILAWNGHEAFGTIVWTVIETAGIEFEDDIDPAILIETRDMQDRAAAKGGLRSFHRDAARKWVQGGSPV